MVMTPTISSPSAEDFSGLTISHALMLSGGGIRPRHTAAEILPDGAIFDDFTGDLSLWTQKVAGTWEIVDVGGTKWARHKGSGWLEGIGHTRRIKASPCWVLRLRQNMLGVGDLLKGFAPTALYDYPTGYCEWPGSFVFCISASGCSSIGVVDAGVSLGDTYAHLGAYFDGINWVVAGFQSSGPGRSTLTADAECPISTKTRAGATDSSGAAAWTNGTLFYLHLQPYTPAKHLFTALVLLPFGAFSAEDRITAQPYAELPAASAFTPSGGANLARLLSITPTLDSTGASGTVTLYMQKYGTEHGWTSLGGVADAWTSLGACVSGVPFDLSAYEMRGGAKTRWKAEFTSTDGTLPPPALSGLALAWESDTDAPGVPTITQLLSSCGVGGVGPRPVLQISSLPSGARHIEVEVDRKPSGGDWAGSLPLSARNAIESGQGYLELRGAQAAEQAAGEENALHLAVPGAWAVGDEVRAKARAVDAMGNASAWTDTTAAVEIVQPYPAPMITDVDPLPLTEDGGDEITVTGTGFLDGASVALNGEPCADVVVVSDTEITATTPAAEYGAGTLTVTNPDGQEASIGVQVGEATYIQVPVGVVHLRIRPETRVRIRVRS